MHSPTPGITFRGAMSGWFHLGSVDPVAGAAQGEAARTRLTLAITVTIPDARGFISAADQPGALDATISYAPLGRELRSTHGMFNLLPPAAGESCRVAAIECAFDARGTPYYLTARVDVPARGHDVFRDRTAVPVALHEGADGRAAIVGAGVLYLTADEMGSLVTSIRVTDAESLGESTLALTGFGRHFLGELWEVYADPPGPFARRWRALTGGARRLIGKR